MGNGGGERFSGPGWVFSPRGWVGFSGDGLAPQLDLAGLFFSALPFLLGVSLALVWFRAFHAFELKELGVSPSNLPGTSSDPSWA